MKNTQKGFAKAFLIGLLAVGLVGGGAYVYLNKAVTDDSVEAVPNVEVKDAQTGVEATDLKKETEKVACSTAMPSRCFLYRCETGYVRPLEFAPPGGIPFECSDGSRIQRVKEVFEPLN